MGARRIAAIALSGALLAGGAGAAIAAVTRDDGGKAEQAVLDDAAKRLSVTPEKLREALAAAQDAQLDRAVEDGDLTQRQADEIKAARRQSGRLLGPLRGPRPHKRFAPRAGRPGMRLRGGLGAELAEALGTPPQKLRDALRSGTSLAELAKANGTTVAELRSALEAAARTWSDKAVEDGDLTRRQADRILERLGERIDALASGRRLRPPRHHHGRHAMPEPPAAVRPGALLPGEQAPRLAPPGGETFS